MSQPTKCSSRIARRSSRWASCAAISVLCGMGAGLISLFLITYSPIGDLRFHVSMNSSSSGYSQLFIADEGNSFTEARSRGSAVQPGQNSLVIPLPHRREMIGSFQRWDPINTPAQITVNEMWIQGLFFRHGVPLDSLRPSMYVSAVEIIDDQAVFSTLSNDGQLLLSEDLSSLFSKHQQWLNSIALAIGLIVLAAAFSLCWLLVRGREHSRQFLNTPSRVAQIVVIFLLTSALVSLMAWGLSLQ